VRVRSARSIRCMDDPRRFDVDDPAQYNHRAMPKLAK
jgi:hypothetical protein